MAGSLHECGHSGELVFLPLFDIATATQPCRVRGARRRVPIGAPLDLTGIAAAPCRKCQTGTWRIAREVAGSHWPRPKPQPQV